MLSDLRKFVERTTISIMCGKEQIVQRDYREKISRSLGSASLA